MTAGASTSLRTTLLHAPMLPAAISLTAGILLYIAYPHGWISFATVAAVATCLIFKWNHAAIMASFLTMGIISAQFNYPRQPSDRMLDSEVTVSGVVKAMHENEESRTMIVEVDTVDNQPVRGFRVFVTNWSFYPEITETQRVKFRSTLSLPEPNGGMPDETDLAEVLWKKRVVAVTQIRRDDVVSISDEPGMLNSLRRINLKIKSIIGATSMSQFSKQFLITTLTGDSEMFTPDERLAFSRAGIAHVLALSGLHVAIISLLLSILLWPMMIFGLWKWRRVLIVIILWVYAVITGLTPSVVRAVIMASLLTFTFVTERRPAPLNSLSFAAILILLFSPWSIYSIGFQLSFLSVLSILLLARKLNPVPERNRLGYRVMSLFTVTFAAVIATGIVSAYYFRVFPVWFFLANIPVTLLLPFIIGGGAVVTACSALGLHATIVEQITDFLCRMVKHINEFVNALPGASIDGVEVNRWQITLFVIVIALLTLSLYTLRRRHLLMAVAAMAGLALVTFFPQRLASEPVAYIPRHSAEPAIIVPSGHILRVFTPKSERHHDTVRQRCLARYAGFMQRRRIDSVEVVSAANRMVRVNEHKALFVTSNSVPMVKDSVDYLIVCGGYKGSITELYRGIPHRQILLGSDIRSKRHDAYLDSLKTLPGAAVISLRRSPVYIY